MLNLGKVLRELAGQRPVFHSEADFQHALAMEIARHDPSLDVRLEYRPLNDERIYLDLWVSDGSRRLAVELKYKTRAARIDWKDERFDLAHHGAPDLGGYDVWKDVQRLERVCAGRTDTDGCVIFLTNDPAYWNDPASDGTIGSAFRPHEGREATGGLFWASHAGDGTMKNREEPLVLRGHYRVTWNDYARLGVAPGLTFRFTVLPVAAVESVGQTPEEPLPEATPTSSGIPIAEPVRPTSATPMDVGRGSRYRALHDYLKGLTVERIELTFGEIEKILGFPLPDSARKYGAFWANHHGGTHVWATQWMDAGWRTEKPNLAAERVTFVRG